jgi:hypothetical protein
MSAVIVFTLICSAINMAFFQGFLEARYGNHAAAGCYTHHFMLHVFCRADALHHITLIDYQTPRVLGNHRAAVFLHYYFHVLCLICLHGLQKKLQLYLAFLGHRKRFKCHPLFVPGGSVSVFPQEGASRFITP